jgi:hypothetical protein
MVELSPTGGNFGGGGGVTSRQIANLSEFLKEYHTACSIVSCVFLKM